jgi:hypothetical protein
MTTFSRSRMARGAKLLLEHAFTPISAVATALSAKGFDKDNLRDASGSFRADVWFPAATIGSIWSVDPLAAAVVTAANGYDNTRHFAVAIPIIPTQDELDTNGQLFSGDAIPVLEEVSISFDQGAEPGFFKETWDMPEDTAINASIKVLVLGKTALWLDADAGHDPDVELFSAELPTEAFVGNFFRFNPQVWANLRASVSPYKTLVVAISADTLGQVFSESGANYELPSMLVSLKFSTKLMPHGTQLQNQPSHVGTTAADTVTVTPPASGAPIEADTGPGLQTNLGILDGSLLRRLRGGFAADGWRPRSTHITSDSAYMVMVVPMFSNFGVDNQLNALNVRDHPYHTAIRPGRNIWDETYIPLNWPIEIHHVYAVTNYGAPNGQANWSLGLGTGVRGIKPTSATLWHDIGLGLYTGIRSDHVAWEQVARLNVLASGLSAYTIDRARVVSNQTMTDEDYQFEVVQVPLVGAGGTAPKNVAGVAIAQGTPVYAARGTTRSSARSAINGGAAATRGLEQHLCVRWKIEDTGVGLDSAAANHIYAGVGGNFVVIIGKRPLVGDDWPVTL